MSTKFLENNHVFHAAPLASVTSAISLWEGVGATEVNGEVMSMKNADGAVWIVPIATYGTGTASVRICACDDVTPSNSVAISFRYTRIDAPDTIAETGEATSYLTSTLTECVYVFEVDAAKVVEQGYEFVTFNSDVVAGADTEGAIIGFLTGLRYKEDDIGTQAT